MFIRLKTFEQMIADLHEARAGTLRHITAAAAAQGHVAVLEQRVRSLDAERQREQGHHEDVCETFEQIRGELTEKTARIASLEAHLDWLSQHVNRLEAERTQLLARIGVGVATPVIEYNPEQFGTPASQAPSNLARDEDVEQGTPEDSIHAAVHQAVSFEDMGDDAAAVSGVKHAADGTVLYTR